MTLDMKALMKPSKLSATAEYIRYLYEDAILRDMVMEKYMKATRSVFDNLQLRQIHDETVKECVSICGDKKQPYAVRHFVNTKTKCSVEGCNIVIEGVYLEVINPITFKNIVIPMEIVHNLIHHQIPGFNEIMKNLGDSPMGITPTYFEIKNFMKVVESVAHARSGR